MVERDARTAALTLANDHIRGVAEKSVSQGEEWMFFCECGTGCDELVPLAVDSYLALRQGRGAVLAPGHHISRAEEARRDAKRVREEARA